MVGKIAIIISIIIGGSTLLFFIFGLIGAFAIDKPNAAETFPYKIGWSQEHQGAFHKEMDCWGKIHFTIGNDRLKGTEMWMTTDDEIVTPYSLQEGVSYTTWAKHYTNFGFIPDNVFIIESRECNPK